MNFLLFFRNTNCLSFFRNTNYTNYTNKLLEDERFVRFERFVSKINIQHSTFNIIENGFTKLHQAGVSPALFSGFRPGRGKSPSDEMDSKMHPALRAVAEEWIQQKLQGVQSSASILYFLPFGRTLIFISDNRWVSVSNSEHRWVGKMKCCIFALWFRKSLPQISQICTDSLRCKQRYSLRLTAKTPRGVKNLWKSV